MEYQYFAYPQLGSVILRERLLLRGGRARSARLRNGPAREPHGGGARLHHGGAGRGVRVRAELGHGRLHIDVLLLEHVLIGLHSGRMSLFHWLTVFRRRCCCNMFESDCFNLMTREFFFYSYRVVLIAHQFLPIIFFCGLGEHSRGSARQKQAAQRASSPLNVISIVA